MSQAGAEDPSLNSEPKLPLRDWFLLPLIGFFTVGAICLLVSFIASRKYAESQSSSTHCLITDDSSTGVRAVPNSVCWEKDPETALVEYRFNSCGHRAGMECGRKPPATFRIVLIGSSFGFALRVAESAGFGAILPAELSRRTGRNVELYNESMQWGYPPSTVLRLDDVFAEKPDLILWALTPYDVLNVSQVSTFAANPPLEQGGFFARNVRHVRKAFASGPPLQAITTIRDLADTGWQHTLARFQASQTAYLLEDLLYRSQYLTAHSLLIGGDVGNGYLRSSLSPEWQEYLQGFEGYDAIIEQRARREGVPLVAVLLPVRGQAAMIAMNELPDGWNPYKLDDELRSVITQNGGTYVDILPEFRSIPNPERNYFAVDGHPNEQGHKLIAAFLADAMTNGSIPALSRPALSNNAAAHQPSAADAR
jgi:hypothetical protein